ncbi:hypothetical protein Slip_0627 [Syntrophothermus lipocalidus DSM 12680]|uniref:Uncharacterized protein n=1 Tax=Syntrophothermus lipocalidus (strain DSM 12680 / TGB-C1) TaxID=643648 RepID=D7CL26_SYNLT|nr:hypothetical protein Slip_0627 [Syntrophothermus lipocalidus DSM 12680]
MKMLLWRSVSRAKRRMTSSGTQPSDNLMKERSLRLPLSAGQHTAKLRAAKRSAKQEVLHSEGLSSGTQDECSLEALSDFPEHAIP